MIITIICVVLFLVFVAYLFALMRETKEQYGNLFGYIAVGILAFLVIALMVNK
ncbi:hypothetical protein ACFVRR_17610 [Gottfriedia sp. NPDC057948]|uniref:hypothetical protein n=1 Tax=Gottfriedia sp. NPDC057948 TaxID=3346287 RepID=UPI0036D9EFCF